MHFLQQKESQSTMLNSEKFFLNYCVQFYFSKPETWWRKNARKMLFCKNIPHIDKTILQSYRLLVFHEAGTFISAKWLPPINLSRRQSTRFIKNSFPFLPQKAQRPELRTKKCLYDSTWFRKLNVKTRFWKRLAAFLFVMELIDIFLLVNS